jgi:hypothetical protein
MIHTAELDLEQFRTGDSHSKPIELEVWNYWAEHGYPVESIIEAYSAVHSKVDDKDTAHVVLKVETLSKPLDKADVAVDQTEIYCCDCKGYQYHYSVDLEDSSVVEWDSCPHIEAIDKTVKAQADDQQDTL